MNLLLGLKELTAAKKIGSYSTIGCSGVLLTRHRAHSPGPDSGTNVFLLSIIDKVSVSAHPV